LKEKKNHNYWFKKKGILELKVDANGGNFSQGEK